MPRSGRGGKRQGNPGTAYSNRSDLTQAPSAAPGQVYGAAAAQLRGQAQAPLPQQSPPPSPAAAGSAPAGQSSPAGAAPVEPGGLGPLNAQSSRPGEPLTAGLASGPGPGPEAIGNPTDPTLYQLKGILARYPNPDLQALITEAESR